MDLQVTQAELEARAVQIMRTNPDPNQLVSKIFGPLEDWIMELGPYKLMLIPWTQMWWQYDRVHEAWDATGIKAGTGEFVLVGEEIELRPYQAAQEHPGSAQPERPVSPVKSEPKPAVLEAEPAPVMVEAATMIEAPAEPPYEAATMIEQRPAVWKLVFLSGPRLNEQFVLGEFISLGREKDNQVILLDPKVSRHHAVIQQQPGADPHGSGYVLIDKGSSNGTFLNGQRLRAPTPLKNDDKITIGMSEIVVNVS